MKKPLIPGTAPLPNGRVPRTAAALTLGMMLASSAAFASPGADPSAPPTGAAAVKPAAKAAPAVQAKRSKSKGNRGEPLVVTGSLIPQRPETGKSVAMADPALQIIDRKTIERSGAGDLRRLLTRTVAGVR